MTDDDISLYMIELIQIL